MKIAQVVTYLSPDGAFGGPTRVAEAQCAALAEQGHEVQLFAAAPIDAPAETLVDGYRLRLFPARRLSSRLGFAGMRAVGLTPALRREAPFLDVAHVHLARDLVTLPAARALKRTGVPYVVQPHGMIDASDRVLAGPVDALWTRSALREAERVLTLTSQEDDDMASIEPRAQVSRIRNGIRVETPPAYEGREQIVLFLARLHPRKRPVAFVEMAALVSARCPEARFVLAGPDEGELAAARQAVDRLGLAAVVEIHGAVSPDQTDALLRSAGVYVLPSVGEVFPMTVLEAFRAGTPVVVTDSLGISDDCREYEAAIVTDGSVPSLADAVASVLNERDQALVLRSGALDYLRERLDISSVALSLSALYEGAAERG
ncbi:glycosyltransferase [Microbacterium sp. X-17]|uniref:glycosyltransferase n=1 Tax=Microbacterium sp. X-17 TaxID=3144404 RepID=UPI0031F5466B